MSFPAIRTQREYTIPQLHLITIWITACILALCLVLYQFSTPAKESLYVTIAPLMVGFLTGKLTNSFGKPVISTSTTSMQGASGSNNDPDNAGETSSEV